MNFNKLAQALMIVVVTVILLGSKVNAFQITEPSSEARDHYKQAMQYYRAKDSAKGLAELRAAIRLAPNFIEAQRAYLNREIEHIELLLPVYEGRVAREPDSKFAHYLLGKTLLNCGRRTLAATEFQKALEIDHEFSWALYELGQWAYLNEDSAKATALWERARKQAGTSSELHYLLAAGFDSIKAHQQALEESGLALTADPVRFAAYPIKWKAQMNLVTDSTNTLGQIRDEIKGLELEHHDDIAALFAVYKGYDIIVEPENRDRAERSILAIDKYYFQPIRHFLVATGKERIIDGIDSYRIGRAQALKDPKAQLEAFSKLDDLFQDIDVKVFFIYPGEFKAYLKLGDLANCERVLKKQELGQGRPADIADELIELAQAYVEKKTGQDVTLGHLRQAIPIVNEVIDQYNGNQYTAPYAKGETALLARALRLEGEVLNDKDSGEQAVGPLSESVKLVEDEANTFDLGLTYAKLHQEDQAIDMLARAYAFQGGRKQEALEQLHRIYGQRETAKPLEKFLAEMMEQRMPKISASAASPIAPISSSVAIGKLAPDFELTSISGEKFHLANLRGKVVLLNFWETSCGPCVAEWPFVQDLQKSYQDKNVVAALISIDSERYRIPIFLKSHPTSASVLMANPGVRKAYNLQAVPLTVVIDAAGVIRYQKMGIGAGDEKELRELLKALTN